MVEKNNKKILKIILVSVLGSLALLILAKLVMRWFIEVVIQDTYSYVNVPSARYVAWDEVYEWPVDVYNETVMWFDDALSSDFTDRLSEHLKTNDLLISPGYYNIDKVNNFNEVIKQLNFVENKNVIDVPTGRYIAWNEVKECPADLYGTTSLWFNDVLSPDLVDQLSENMKNYNLLIIPGHYIIDDIDDIDAMWNYVRFEEVTYIVNIPEKRYVAWDEVKECPDDIYMDTAIWFNDALNFDLVSRLSNYLKTNNLLIAPGYYDIYNVDDFDKLLGWLNFAEYSTIYS